MEEGRSIPTSVTVFGILNTIFGTFGLVTSPLSLARLNESLSLFKALGVGSLVLAWVQISAYLAPVMSFILLALGIGLLMKRSWGRSGSIYYSYVSIALSVLLTIMMLSLQPGSSGSEENTMFVAIKIGTIIGGLLGLIYPILTIVFLSKPSVKAALERRTNG